MTNETIPEGRALDIALAKALGWTIEKTKSRSWMHYHPEIVRDPTGKVRPQIPLFATDPAAMLALIAVMRKRGWKIDIEIAEGKEHYVRMFRYRNTTAYIGESPSLPVAVAHAAWRALVGP